MIGGGPVRTDPAFWAGRRVLVTGHTGFKGAWLTTRLVDMGAVVLGLSLPGPHYEPSLWESSELDIHEIRADIAGDGWQQAIDRFAPQTAFHLAAQALVPEAAHDPVGTFRTNVLGTANLLAALGQLAPSPDSTVIVTTDKVYHAGMPGPYSEDAPMWGAEPYSASKVGAELVVRSWPGLWSGVATVRAGNVIGGGDAAPRRLIPDLIRAWSREETAVLRRPGATRPWQHVCESLDGYLRLAQLLARSHEHPAPTALNFGPALDQHATVIECVVHAATTWSRLVGCRLPSWTVTGEPALAETDALVLNSELAWDTLDWRPRWGWREAIERTIAWHISVRSGTPSATAMRRDWDSLAGSVVS